MRAFFSNSYQESEPVKLLLVTDHRFLLCSEGVFDTYCFGSSFFDDYLSVFDSVEVCSRLAATSSLPSGSLRSDGPGISFLSVPDITGFQWILRAGSVSRALLDKAIGNADAVVVRAPGQLAYWAAKVAYRKQKPYMVEVIGDPAEAISHAGQGWHFKILAWWEMKRLQSLVRSAAVVSYVSKHHLQIRYPARQDALTDNISSIRLSDAEISSPRKYRTNINPFQIVFVGSLLPYKRQADLIRAAARCRNRGVPVQVHLAGGGPQRNWLEKLSLEQKIYDHVFFYGHIADRRQLVALLDKADLFVITSASEGLPRSVLEGMARGLPVVGSRAGGIPELVRESELFEIGDVEKLAQLLCCLYKNPGRLEMMSKYSIETAKKYTITALSPRRQRLYAALREAASQRKRSN